jgi:hypothetical protein
MSDNSIKSTSYITIQTSEFVTTVSLNMLGQWAENYKEYHSLLGRLKGLETSPGRTRAYIEVRVLPEDKPKWASDTIKALVPVLDLDTAGKIVKDIVLRLESMSRMEDTNGSNS